MDECDASLNKILDLALIMAEPDHEITKDEKQALRLSIQNHSHKFISHP